VPSTKRLDFGDDPNQEQDSGIFPEFVKIAKGIFFGDLCFPSTLLVNVINPFFPVGDIYFICLQLDHGNISADNIRL